MVPSTPDMMSPVTSGQRLSKFEKAENTASDGFESNFTGSAFGVSQPIGGLLVRQMALCDVLRTPVSSVFVRHPSQSETVVYLENILT